MTQLTAATCPARNLVSGLLADLAADENGFIVSAELVLVATIAVLAMIVGLSEVSHNVNQELEDVGSAFTSLDQSWETCGTRGHKGWKSGSCFHDRADFCDGQSDINGSY